MKIGSMCDAYTIKFNISRRAVMDDHITKAGPTGPRNILQQVLLAYITRWLVIEVAVAQSLRNPRYSVTLTALRAIKQKLNRIRVTHATYLPPVSRSAFLTGHLFESLADNG
jgi:hypothetical protein